MKITKYKIADSGATAGAAKSHTTNGRITPNFSAETLVDWYNPRFKEVIGFIDLDATGADAAAQYDVTIAGTAPVAGEVLTLTISYQDSRQRVNKVLKVYAAGGETVTALAILLRDAINDSGAPFTATNAAGVVTITADTAGAGYEPKFTVGTDSATATIAVQAPGAATNDAVKTDAAYYEANYGIDASKFGSQTAAYLGRVFKVLVSYDASPTKGATYEYIAYFADSSINVDAIDDDLFGDSIAAIADVVDYIELPTAL